MAVPVAPVIVRVAVVLFDDLGEWALRFVGAVLLLMLVPLGLTVLSFGGIVALIAGATALGGFTTAAPGVDTSTSAPPRSAVLRQALVSTRTPSGLIAGWANRPALNQYERGNYRTKATWLTWRDADCSAAALMWLLGAYGQPLGAIDDAIALIGPNTGISTRLGLLDARGPALARAVTARGLVPRTPGRAPLASIQELKMWLDEGPLLMDGGRWFGYGHWFVGIAYDANGIYIRDSSGWDTRYLTWSRLYGDVGFSGWVVGISP